MSHTGRHHPSTCITRVPKTVVGLACVVASLVPGPSNAARWFPLSPGGGLPSARVQHAAAYDPVRDRLLVLGGNANGALVNDTWALSLAGAPAWSMVATAGTPPSARRGHSAIYDPTRDRLIVFGGHDGAYKNDTWQLALGSNPPTWSPLTPGGAPPPIGLYGHVAVYDPVRNQMVVFGGDYGGPSERDDAWALSLGEAPAWSQFVPETKPPRRALFAGVYDPVGDRMVIWGGRSGSRTHINDTWALSLGSGEWAELSPAGVTPDGRESPAGVYDPVERQMVLFGGWNNSGNQSDLRGLRLTGQPTWTPIPTTGNVAPTARWGHVSIYHPGGDRMILFGGLDLSGFRNDAWELRWLVRPGREEELAQEGGVVAGALSPSLGLGVPAPNPIVTAATARFSLPIAGRARLDLFDVAGRHVRTLADGTFPAGEHAVAWDRAGDGHDPLGAGIYLLRLETTSGTLARKVMLR